MTVVVTIVILLLVLHMLILIRNTAAIREPE
jgi:hypothetical protein